MGTREPCPAWCSRHTAARCRSAPVETAAWQHGGRIEVAVLLESRAGETALVVLLPDAPPIYVPQVGAVGLVDGIVGLVERAGWTITACVSP